MGGLMSYVFPNRVGAENVNDPSLDIPDPKTKLTPRQKNVIRENWSEVKKDVRGNGVDFFIAFFKAYPSYQKTFKSFAEVPFEQLKENRKVHAHAFSVMHALESMVENLDDVDCLFEILKKTGENHRRHSITILQFQHLSVVFVQFLSDKLGNAFTPFARTAWLLAFDVIASIIAIGLEGGDST